MMTVSIHALTRSATTGGVDQMRVTVVSIHALTRSATLCISLRYRSLAVSIHALTRSATNAVYIHPKESTLFQSTHSRGVRQWPPFYSVAASSFNPRTHEECDPSWMLICPSRVLFQSTHSRGVRLFQKSVFQ